MTHATKRAPRQAAIPAAMLAAVLLAGCSTGHIGESWQCPLAEGGTCDSVAAADPAVPDPKAAGTAVLAEPLWRVRGDELAETPPVADCAMACGERFGPFAGLARLFGGGGPMVGEPEPVAADTAPEPAAPSTAPAGTKPPPEDPATALLPAEPEPAQHEPEAGDLRTDEVVARIWIAPFVDADGVYREASHVRVVLEPAGWRLK